MTLSKSNYSIFHLIRSDLTRFYGLLHSGHGSSPFFLTFWALLFSPRMTPVLLYRIAHFFHRYGFKIFAKLFTCLNFFLFGIEIACACSIGPGLFFPHTYGTVIGAAYIGSNVTIFQGSTIGTKYPVFDYDPSLRPKLGSFVTIGAGAKVLGDIYIGDNVIIGANSVVLASIPPHSVAVGIPARII